MNWCGVGLSLYCLDPHKFKVYCKLAMVVFLVRNERHHLRKGKKRKRKRSVGETEEEGRSVGAPNADILKKEERTHGRRNLAHRVKQLKLLKVEMVKEAQVGSPSSQTTPFSNNTIKSPPSPSISKSIFLLSLLKLHFCYYSFRVFME